MCIRDSLRVVVASAQPAATRAQATLTIPGLLGQPADSLAVEMTETTATITAFGRAVWSCVRAAGREHGPTGAGRRKSPKRPASCSGPAWGPLRRRTLRPRRLAERPRRAPPFRFPTQVLRGLADPDSARTEVEPATPPMTPMQPVVTLTVDKAQSGRWGGLIKQIGEDSLIQ